MALRKLWPVFSEHPVHYMKKTCTYGYKHKEITPSVYESEDSVLRLVYNRLCFRDVPVSIINLRCQSSLQMPKYTISHAFCICTMYSIWNRGLSQVLRFIHSAICDPYMPCTHVYESEDSYPVLRFLYKGMFNSNTYQSIGYYSLPSMPQFTISSAASLPLLWHHVFVNVYSGYCKSWSKTLPPFEHTCQSLCAANNDEGVNVARRNLSD